MMRKNTMFRKYIPSLLLFLLFELVAITLWIAKYNIFYLLNFSYIGGCLALGTALFTAGKCYARHFVQLAVGSYMLLYLGIISCENMQIEGFWYYLFLGVFEAATIHYAVAKIFGPLLFGRGWCGYACWTAMVLDFLPYKQPKKPRKEKLGVLRYVMFVLSLAVVLSLFLMKIANLERIMFWIFLVGNTFYYIVGARHFVQLAVGSYMLLYLGIISCENMQIEGFWYYLFLGVFEAATIHYAVAKIFGPLLFGRGWCGYACWTAMVLDFLPYKQPKKPRKEKLGVLRYVMFVLSLAVVLSLFLMKIANLERIMFWIFLVGNTFYYIVGIVLAFVFKDNRAFCKYLCPVTVFLKPMSYFSLLRVHCDENKCIHCGKCLKVCPMNVEVNKESRKRKNGTECILCYECTKVCPTKALH